jgi:hypothetical protein
MQRLTLPEDIINLLLQLNLQLRGRFARTCKEYYNKLQHTLDKEFYIIYPEVENALIAHNIPALRKLITDRKNRVTTINVNIFDGSDKAIDTYIFTNHYHYWFWNPTSKYDILKLLIMGPNINNKKITPSMKAVQKLIDHKIRYNETYYIQLLLQEIINLDEKWISVIFYLFSHPELARTSIIDTILLRINNTIVRKQYSTIPGIQECRLLLSRL